MIYQFLTRAQIQALATHLAALGCGEAQPNTPQHGICEEVEHFVHTQPGPPSPRMTTALMWHARSWPRHSGTRTFPVPGPEGSDPATVYLEYPDGEDMWDPLTEYGRLRRDLCRHLAMELVGVLAGEEGHDG